MVHQLVNSLNELFQLGLKIPVESTLPEETQEGSGAAKLEFWGGNKYTIQLAWYRGEHGLILYLKRIFVAMTFEKNEGEDWITELRRFAGPIEWVWDSECARIRFVIDGHALQTLEVNALNRKGDLPVLPWDHPRHARHHWGN
ncbi:hypothetical protein ACFL2B_02800 [Patescibacteria group bacterium]